jgi:Galactose oxidase-like, Early set domain
LQKPTSALIYVQSPSFDLFCAGHAQLPDGGILFAGGTDEFPAEAHTIHQGIHFEGHRHAVIYDPSAETFVVTSDMNAETVSAIAGGGRWYPTLCTLGNGALFVAEGHPSGSDSRHGNNTPETFDNDSQSWTLLPSFRSLSQAPILYPRLHLLPSGLIFISSRIPVIPVDTQNISINPYSSATNNVSSLPDPAYHGFDCPSVLLPLVPADQYRARILLCGGIHTQMIDLGASNPAWSTVTRNGSAAASNRSHACATLLPTGDVLITGGTSVNDQQGVLLPEIYRTPIDHNTYSYVGGVGFSETINEPAAIIRNYHSTALLMPDGRVWTAGGNAPSQPDYPATATQKSIEIFDPPYPTGPRPSIVQCPSFVAYNHKFEISTLQANDISGISLLRCGSSTHAFNPDQRMIVLGFSKVNVNTLESNAPPNGNVAPPGSYMLFLIDNQGRPCSYAKFVRVGRPRMIKKPDRTFWPKKIFKIILDMFNLQLTERKRA